MATNYNQRKPVTEIIDGSWDSGVTEEDFGKDLASLVNDGFRFIYVHGYVYPIERFPPINVGNILSANHSASVEEIEEIRILLDNIPTVTVHSTHPQVFGLNQLSEELQAAHFRYYWSIYLPGANMTKIRSKFIRKVIVDPADLKFLAVTEAVNRCKKAFAVTTRERRLMVDLTPWIAFFVDNWSWWAKSFNPYSMDKTLDCILVKAFPWIDQREISLWSTGDKMFLLMEVLPEYTKEQVLEIDEEVPVAEGEVQEFLAPPAIPLVSKSFTEMMAEKSSEADQEKAESSDDEFEDVQPGTEFTKKADIKDYSLDEERPATSGSKTDDTGERLKAAEANLLHSTKEAVLLRAATARERIAVLNAQKRASALSVVAPVINPDDKEFLDGIKDFIAELKADNEIIEYVGFKPLEFRKHLMKLTGMAKREYKLVTSSGSNFSLGTSANVHNTLTIAVAIGLSRGNNVTKMRQRCSDRMLEVLDLLKDEWQVLSNVTAVNPQDRKAQQKVSEKVTLMRIVASYPSIALKCLIGGVGQNLIPSYHDDLVFTQIITFSVVPEEEFSNWAEFFMGVAYFTDKVINKGKTNLKAMWNFTILSFTSEASTAVLRETLWNEIKDRVTADSKGAALKKLREAVDGKEFWQDIKAKIADRDPSAL